MIRLASDWKWFGSRIFNRKYTAVMDMKPGNIPRTSMTFIIGRRILKRILLKA